MNNNVCSRIVGPFENVDYSNMIIDRYQRRTPNGSIMRHPFIGFKILMRDRDAFRGSSSERIRYLETYVPRVFTGTGCFLRETNNNIMPDGYWLISLPVPLIQLNDPNYNQANKTISAMESLETVFNFSRQGRVEINVSGRCTVPETENRLANIYIPDNLKQFHSITEGSAYTMGKIQRINNKYALLRTTWNFGPMNSDGMKNAMVQMAYNISAMYR